MTIAEPLRCSFQPRQLGVADHSWDDIMNLARKLVSQYGIRAYVRSLMIENPRGTFTRIWLITPYEELK
jgi:hypothetical protein